MDKPDWKYCSLASKQRAKEYNEYETNKKSDKLSKMTAHFCVIFGFRVIICRYLPYANCEFLVTFKKLSNKTLLIFWLPLLPKIESGLTG